MRVGIVGGGLTGRLLAWRLSQADWDITLFDQGSELGEKSAAYVAAGMLSPYAELVNSTTAIYEWGLESLALWKKWLPQIQQPISFHQKGSLVVSHPNDREELDQFSRLLQARVSKTLPVWKKEDFEQKEPDLSFNEGLFLAEEGQIHPRELLLGLYRELTHRNVRFYLNTFVSNVLPHQIIVDNKTDYFDWVFDCRGFGATESFKGLRNVRGEIITLQAPAISFTRPVRLLHPRYQIYVVPRQDNIYVVGASEVESNDDTSISVRSCLELLSAVYSIHPGFAEARILETCSAKRAAFPDNLPQWRNQSGLTEINGLYRHGFLIAPALINNICRELFVLTKEAA